MPRAPDPKRVARLHLAVTHGDPLYPDAGENAQPEVREAIARWRKLPEAEKVEGPLWFWLLGSSTPDYKLPRRAVDYEDPSPIANRQCGNCRYSYSHVKSRNSICSVIRGTIQPSAWCRLWEG